MSDLKWTDPVPMTVSGVASSVTLNHILKPFVDRLGDYLTYRGYAITGDWTAETLTLVVALVLFVAGKGRQYFEARKAARGPFPFPSV